MSALDLSKLDEKVMLARGQYATVRAAREDAIKLLQRQCSDLQSLPSVILRAVQEGESVDHYLSGIDEVVAQIKTQTSTVLDLHRQKETIKPEAWGKSPAIKE